MALANAAPEGLAEPEATPDADAPRPARDTIRSLERRARGAFPVTLRGGLVAALCAGSLFAYGYGQLDLVVFVLGVSGLALLCVASLAALGTALALRRRLRRPEARRERASVAARFLEAGEPFATRFAVRLPRWMPFARVEWSWVEPEGVACRLHEQGDACVEEIVPRRRHEARRVCRRFRVRDAFGLASVEWDDGVPAALRVLPWTGPLRHGVWLPAFAAAEGISHPRGAPEGDRMEIRRYVPGDSARDILWKAYARTRQLNVRRPERAIARQRRTIAYLVAAADDEAAAAAARVALESGALGSGWRFGADGCEEPTEELGAALAAVARSGSLRQGRDAAGLETFLGRVARDGDHHCIVFVPGTPGPWLERVLACARRPGRELSFLVAVERTLPRAAPRAPLWQRWLLREPRRTGVSADELERLVAALAPATGVAIVERETGQMRLRGGPIAAPGLAGVVP
jgi:hypothetical protein